MRKQSGAFIRVAGATLLVLALAVPGAGTANAQAPALINRDGYTAQSAGRALVLNVLGQSPQTFGYATTKIVSDLTAVAEAAGRLLDPGTTSKAESKGNNTTSKVPATGLKCLVPPLGLPGPLASVLDLGIACSSAESSIQNELPLSKSRGTVLNIDLRANPVLNQIIQPIQAPLNQVFGPLPAQLDPVTNTVADLLTALGATQTLAVRIGDALAESTTTSKQVSTSAITEAGHIDILPNSIFGEYFARILIGSARASATLNRFGDQDPTGQVDPAIVSVLFTKLPVAGVVLPPIVVAPSQSVTILAGTPLESTITVAGKSVSKLANGSIASVADGVSVHLLKGVSNGINLQLAHAEAAIAGTPLRVSKVANPTSVPVGQLFNTTISIFNPFECAVENVRVEDIISVEQGARFSITNTDPRADTIPGGSNLTEGKVVWNNIGTIPPKSTRSVTVTTLAQGDESGRIVDIGTATGTLGQCPASALAGAEVVSAALNMVPVASAARLVVPTASVLARTGAGTSATVGGGAALLGLSMALGLASRRRRKK